MPTKPVTWTEDDQRAMDALEAKRQAFLKQGTPLIDFLVVHLWTPLSSDIDSRRNKARGIAWILMKYAPQIRDLLAPFDMRPPTQG